MVNIARYQVPTNSTHWIAHRRRILAQLDDWGYDSKSVSTYGLSREEGFRKFTPTGTVANPDTARIQGNRFYELHKWDSPSHWEWMFENCPMIRMNEFDDEETE